MNNDIREKNDIQVLKTRVELLKKHIVNGLKEEKKLIKDSKKAESANDKKALLEQVKQTRKEIEYYRLTLNDLTYAFIERHPLFSKKLLAKLHYKTPEGYLEDKKNGDMPTLADMMNLLLNHFDLIPLFYEYKWINEKRVLVRNFNLLKKHSYQQNPNYDMYAGMNIHGAIETGAVHK